MNKREIDKLVRIVGALVYSSDHWDLCACLHHKKADMHMGGSTCPVVVRVQNAWDEIVDHVYATTCTPKPKKRKARRAAK